MFFTILSILLNSLYSYWSVWGLSGVKRLKVDIFCFLWGIVAYCSLVGRLVENCLTGPCPTDFFGELCPIWMTACHSWICFYCKVVSLSLETLSIITLFSPLFLCYFFIPFQKYDQKIHIYIYQFQNPVSSEQHHIKWPFPLKKEIFTRKIFWAIK